MVQEMQELGQVAQEQGMATMMPPQEQPVRGQRGLVRGYRH